MIRQYSETDFAQLLIIEARAHIAPWLEETFKQCFKMGARCWVIEHEQIVIGYIITLSQSTECHVLSVTVHPDYQHHGFGRQLLIYALKEAKSKGVGIVYLEVRRSNQHAIDLYKKIGFVEIGERRGYYETIKGREDAIIYAKDLGVDEEL